MKACMDVLEDSWHKPESDLNQQLEVPMAACLIISGYFGGLRGKEISKANLGAMRLHWKELVGYQCHPHVPLVLCGRFKGQIGEKLFCQPLVCGTDGGCPIEMWFVCLMKGLAKKCRLLGSLF